MKTKERTHRPTKSRTQKTGANIAKTIPFRTFTDELENGQNITFPLKEPEPTVPSKKPIKLFPDMKESDMTRLDWKIHDLLIAEGYRVSETQRINGEKSNNYTNVNRMEYIKEGYGRVFVTTQEPKIIPSPGQG